MQSLSELQRPNSADWVIRYGILFIPISVGAILLMRNLALSIQFNPWLSMAGVEVLLIGVFFSRLSLELPSNKESLLSTMLYFGSIFVSLLIILGVYLYRQSKLSTQEQQNSIFPDEILFSLIWFILLLLPARGAIQYNFFFVPIAISFGCYAIIRLLRIMRDKKMRKLFRLMSYILITTLIILVLGHYSGISYIIVKTTQPVISEGWKKALSWLKENSPENSVVASWWDYGSWINTLSGKSTIIDEDHYIPYWIYLMARHVMLGQTENEALEFLKSHGATHLIISAEDILLYPTISYLGSDENFDRSSYIPLFVSENKTVNSNSKVGFFRYVLPGGNMSIDDTLSINGKTYNKKTWSISSILLKTIRNNQSCWEVKEAIIELAIEGKIVEVLPQEVYFKGKVSHNKGEVLPCTIIIYSQNHNPLEWNVLFLQDIARNSMMVRLYILDKHSDSFTPIYPPVNREDEGRQIDYSVKIWKINYQKDIQSKSEYLEKSFSDPLLYRSWVQGIDGIR